ncbi:hypothetical protein N9908_02570 [Akkermansiaceae bacterium]|nr:hypothetical protein [Akkermansiaceae bacterium]MDB4323267.1 hypothetical protein [Akkermansiaceae bacterium]MDB4333656.1 hypothetical protein [Akkermansiaceae bacterium]
MPPPLFPQDKSHLKTLVICHYVIAGLYGLGLFFIILHFAIMSAVFMNPEVIKEGKDDEFIQVFVPIMGAVYGSLILVGLALIVLNILLRPLSHGAKKANLLDGHRRNELPRRNPRCRARGQHLHRALPRQREGCL